MRHEAERRPTGPLGDDRHAVGKEARVAAKLVDQETSHQGGIFGRDDAVGANDLGDDTAAVDIADQHHGHVGGPGEPHVGNVAFAKIDLGRATRALDQHEVGLGLETAEALDHGAQEPRLPGLVLPRLGVADDAALHHDL